MQQGSTVCAARGNYSSWEHRRHYVEFSHLLQSNEAFLVAWVSVSPDMPQCLKCLITTAGIFQLHSLSPQSCSCPVWWLWLINLFLIVFVFCRPVSFPNSFPTSAADWLLLGRRLHRTEPSWKVRWRWKAFEKSWSHFSSRWHHSKMAKAYLVSGSIIRGDAKYASLSQVTTLCCIKPRTCTLHQLGTHWNYIKLRTRTSHQLGTHSNFIKLSWLYVHVQCTLLDTTVAIMQGQDL